MKQQTKRKVLAGVLSLCIVIGLLPATALAAELGSQDMQSEAQVEDLPTEAQLLQGRIDALPEADEVAALMGSEPSTVDAVYEEVRALTEAVAALDEELDTAKLDALAALFAPEAEVLAGVECSGGADCTHEAAIGSKHYDTLAAALSAGSGKVVTLLKDAEVTAVKKLGNNNVYTIDLNNHNIGFAAGCHFLINSKGTLKLIGKGKLYEESPDKAPVVITGVMLSGKTTLNVGEDVTLEGWAGVFISNDGNKNNGIVVNVDGTVIGCTDSNGKNGAGIYINGNIKGTNEKTAAQVTLTETAKVSGSGCGILAAGYAKWNIIGSEITGPTGIEIRAGEMNISGDAKITGTADSFSVTPNASGGTTIGAGIAVAQHTTKLPIKVYITGGEIKGYSALYESNPQKNQDTDLAKITLDVKGGEFETINGGTQVVFSEDKEDFITGGTFSGDVIEYVADDYATSQESDHYIVGPLSAENAAAKITNGETTAYYATLAKAVGTAQNGDTVTLLKDVTLTETVHITNTVTLDLAGNTVKAEFSCMEHSEPMLSVDNSGNLTLMTSEPDGTLDYQNLDDGECVSVSEGGACSITGITIRNAGYGIANNGGTITEIKDCTITNSCFGINTSGTIETITGTTITNNTNGALYIVSGGSVTELSGNNFTSEVDVIFCAGNVTITDGTYTSTGGNALDVNSGTATVNGGTFISGDDAAAYSEWELIINGGDFAGGNGADALECDLVLGGSIQIIGGYFTSDPTDYLAEDHYAIASDKDGFAYMVSSEAPKEAPVIVTEASEASILVTGDDAFAIETALKDNPPVVSGVAAALTLNSKEAILTSAGVTEDEKADAENPIKIEIKVKVDAVSADLSADTKYVTYEVKPVATVSVNGATKGTEVSVPNNYLNGKAITVQLPIPENLEVQEVKHASSDGSVEYFYETGSKQFTKDGSSIVVEIKKFSELKLSGTVTSAATVNGESYETLQKAINAASSGDTITLQPGVSAEEKVNVSGKSLTIELGSTNYPADNISTGSNTSKTVDGTAVKITYSAPSYSGGGGWSDRTYAVVTPSKTDNGKVTASPKSASKGEAVTLTVKPDKGYELDELTVTDAKGNKIKLTAKGGGKYTFKMPGSKVTVEASFAEAKEEFDFIDVPASAYYYDAVAWAVEQDITNGTDEAGTRFSPDEACTRGQVVTFLWRANGCPESKSRNNPFTDVKSDMYYYDAVLWAVEQGITNGTNEAGTLFSPDEVCTRGQIVTFLWRSEKCPFVSAGSSFVDVDANAYYATAVSWAAKEGITNGINEAGTRFSPDNICTRGQIVTFLYRNMVK